MTLRRPARRALAVLGLLVGAALGGCEREHAAAVGSAAWSVASPAAPRSAPGSAASAPGSAASAPGSAAPAPGSAASAPGSAASAPHQPHGRAAAAPAASRAHAHGGDRGVDLARFFEGAPPSTTALPVPATLGMLSLRLPAGWRARRVGEHLVAGAPGVETAWALGPRPTLDRGATVRLHARLGLTDARWEEPIPSALGAMGLPMTVTTGPARLGGAPATAWLVLAELDGDRRLLMLAALRDDAPAPRRAELAAAARSARVAAPR